MVHWTTVVASLASFVVGFKMSRPLESHGDYGPGFELMMRLLWLLPLSLIWLAYAIYW